MLVCRMNTSRIYMIARRPRAFLSGGLLGLWGARRQVARRALSERDTLKLDT